MNSSFGSKTPHARPLELFSLPTKVINSNAWSNSGLTSSQEYRSREHEILQTSQLNLEQELLWAVALCTTTNPNFT